MRSSTTYSAVTPALLVAVLLVGMVSVTPSALGKEKDPAAEPNPGNKGLKEGKPVDKGFKGDNPVDKGAKQPKPIDKGEGKPAFKEGKGAPQEPSDRVSTTVAAIDAAAGTITANIPVPGEKRPASTLKLAANVPVELAPVGKKGEGQPTPGTLADVTAGSSVVLKLSEDRGTVTHIMVMGEQVRGTVKSVDAAAGTVTVMKMEKGEKGAVGIEKTLPVGANTRIAFAGANNGKNKGEKGDPAANEAKLTDIAVGATVSASVSADRKQVASLTIEPRTVAGAVASVDVAKRTITVTSKGKDGAADDVYKVSDNATIVVGQEKGAEKANAGTLADVSAGMVVMLQFAPRDPDSVITVYARNQAPSTKGQK